MNLRCSSCLTEMRLAKGKHVCPRCGQSGTVTLDDGSEAVFEAPGPSGGAWRLPAALALILLAVAAAAAWWWRSELLGLLPGPAPEQVVAEPETPHWRLARREAFAEPLRDGLIGVFGTSGKDRPEAFAALGSGELVTVLAPAAGGAGEAAIVRINGSADIETTFVEVPGDFVGAEIAPDSSSGFYLALTGASGFRLLAYGEGASPAWTRDVARSAAPLRKADVVASGGIVYLAGAAESAGRLGVTAFAEDGAQLWQRSFEAPEDGRAFASAREEGGLFIAFETRVSDGSSEVLALWLSEGGETASVLAGIDIDGRLAGAQAEAAGAVLLVAGSAVSLQKVSPAGELAWKVPVQGAVLHETLFLEKTAPGEISVLSAYRLSDIQTDLSLSRYGADGRELASQLIRLPPEVSAAALSFTRPNSMILLGGIGEGDGADGFLLALEMGGEAKVPRDEEVQQAERSAQNGASGAQATVGAQAAAVTGVAVPGMEARGSVAADGGQGRVCRFVCRDGETMFPLSRTLEIDEAAGDAGLTAIHVEACRMLGAEPAAEALPDCSP